MEDLVPSQERPSARAQMGFPSSHANSTDVRADTGAEEEKSKKNTSDAVHILGLAIVDRTTPLRAQ